MKLSNLKLKLSIIFFSLALSTASLADLSIEGLDDSSTASLITPIITIANQGDAEAQFLLGVMYYHGIGVRQDKVKAKNYLGQACDNGDQEGCDQYRILNEAGF